VYNNSERWSAWRNADEVIAKAKAQKPKNTMSLYYPDGLTIDITIDPGNSGKSVYQRTEESDGKTRVIVEWDNG